MGQGSAQLIAGKAKIGALGKDAIVAGGDEVGQSGAPGAVSPSSFFGFEVDIILRPTELHFRFATGLTLKAYVICREDNQALWRLLLDDR